MMGKLLCWIGWHKWETSFHFTDTHVLNWTGCQRNGCSVGSYTKSNCNYYGPKE